MKTNGVVRRLAASPPGFERWEAKCLLCAWRSGERRVCLQRRSNARDWDAPEGYSQVEPEEASGRRARTVSRQRSRAILQPSLWSCLPSSVAKEESCSGTRMSLTSWAALFS